MQILTKFLKIKTLLNLFKKKTIQKILLDFRLLINVQNVGFFELLFVLQIIFD